LSAVTVKDYYWNWLDHSGDAEYAAGIDRLLGVAEPRLRAFLDQRRVSDASRDVDLLLRLVEIEFGIEDTPRQTLRRDRWRRKIETVTSSLRPGQQVLDCGSGFGTEAIAFALAGASVTAVDVFPVYLGLVERRSAMYGRLFAVDLGCHIQRVSSHLPDYEPNCRYDVVWSNESIEHIAPLERFFGRLPGWLAPHGRVVICNDNALSPIRLAATIRARGSWRARYETRTVPGRAAPIPYGNEVIRSPVATARMLKAAGLGRIEYSMMSVFPSELARHAALLPLAGAAEKLAAVPALRLFVAGDYILEARAG
jgi:2-polyprenyl-3-methyl-5-hydroxy-6-metoxy-1,4-benzoquinol methylase